MDRLVLLGWRCSALLGDVCLVVMLLDSNLGCLLFVLVGGLLSRLLVDVLVSRLETGELVGSTDSRWCRGCPR